MPHDVTILTEAELRRAVRIDLAAIDAVEQAFAALALGKVIMPPILSMAIPEAHGEVDVKTGKRKALYEPVHGSAPDIAGKGLANPIAMIASFGMALRYSFDMGALADQLDAAIAAVLASGLRTADIKSEGTTSVSTTQMGEAILKELQKLRA